MCVLNGTSSLYEAKKLKIKATSLCILCYCLKKNMALVGALDGFPHQVITLTCAVVALNMNFLVHEYNGNAVQ